MSEGTAGPSPVWAGVDVGGTRKGFHIALLDEALSVTLARAATAEDCRALVGHAAVVGIDAPAAWADAGEGSRACERAFAAAGVCGIRPTPDEAAAAARTDRYYEWIERGLELWGALRAAGVQAVECFPTASWTRWIGRRGRTGRGAWSRGGLAALGLDGVRAANQDERDAVAAAVTAWQCDRRPASVERFGDLVVPLAGLPARVR